MTKLLDVGHVYRNPTARWASAPHLVPKPGPAEWRFTGDLRNVNRYTIPIKHPLPVLDTELQKSANCRIFARFDMTHGYWQLLLHPDIQECQSLMTPEGSMAPTRVLYGTVNVNAHLQASFAARMPPELAEHLMLWVDDMAIPTSNIDDHLKYISMLFNLCDDMNFKLHPGKCHLYLTNMNWCGRQISEDGTRFDPRNFDALDAYNQWSRADAIHIRPPMGQNQHTQLRTCNPTPT